MNIQYEEIIKRRNGAPTEPCEICGAVTGNQAHDHCHEHGFVRGVVCPRCNARMRWLDAGYEPVDDPDNPPKSRLISHWEKCPTCATEEWSSTKTRNTYTAVRVHRAARDELRKMSLILSAQAGRRVSMSEALLICLDIARQHPDELRAALATPTAQKGTDSE